MNKALEEFNQRITITGRKPVHATKHPILKDMILIPSVEANYDFPNKNDLPGYRCIIDRRCAEAVLRGSDIYAKGVLSLSKGCNKIGKQVTILATLTHKKIPRGTPVDYFLKAAPVVFIGVGDLKMIRNKVLSGMPDGLAVEVNKERVPESSLLTRVATLPIVLFFFALTKSTTKAAYISSVGSDTPSQSSSIFDVSGIKLLNLGS